MTLALIVENDLSHALILKHNLGGALDCESIICTSRAETQQWMHSTYADRPDFAIIDLFLQDEDSIDLILDLRRHFPGLPIVVMTHYGNRKRALLAIKAGARDFLHKPIPIQRLQVTVQNILETEALRRAAETPMQPLNPLHTARPHIAGNHPLLRKALQNAEQSVRQKMPLVIAGESGTGKSLMAHYLAHVAGFDAAHTESLPYPANPPRSTDKFRIINIYSQEYNIDNNKELPLILNGCSFDILCLTTSPQFPVELLAKCRGVNVELLPPLRQRPTDIDDLAVHFLQQSTAAGKVWSLEPPLLRQMMLYNWPGNIRELEQFIYGAAPYAENRLLTLDAWQFHLGRQEGKLRRTSANPREFQVSLTAPDGEIRPYDEIEMDILRMAMEKYRHSPSTVAKRLGIGRTTIYRKMQKMDLPESS